MNESKIAVFLRDRWLNEQQRKTIADVVRRANGASWADVVLRVNGEEVRFEADWIKRLEVVEEESS